MDSNDRAYLLTIVFSSSDVPLVIPILFVGMLLFLAFIIAITKKFDSLKE